MAASVGHSENGEATRTEVVLRKDEATDTTEIRMSVLSDKPDGEEVFTNAQFTPLLSNNQYTVRKMAAQAMMDVALMMANISQLRTLVTGGVTHVASFYSTLALVIFSLVSQLVFGILIFIIWARESSAHQRDELEERIRKREFPDETGSEPEAVGNMRLSIMRYREHYKHDVVTNRLNHVTMVLVFLITVANMFITGLGVEPPLELTQQGQTGGFMAQNGANTNYTAVA